jgi:hypothetical protein
VRAPPPAGSMLVNSPRSPSGLGRPGRHQMRAAALLPAIGSAGRNSCQPSRVARARQAEAARRRRSRAAGLASRRTAAQPSLAEWGCAPQMRHAVPRNSRSKLAAQNRSKRVAGCGALLPPPPWEGSRASPGAALGLTAASAAMPSGAAPGQVGCASIPALPALAQGCSSTAPRPTPPHSSHLPAGNCRRCRSLIPCWRQRRPAPPIPMRMRALAMHRTVPPRRIVPTPPPRHLRRPEPMTRWRLTNRIAPRLPIGRAILLRLSRRPGPMTQQHQTNPTMMRPPLSTPVGQTPIDPAIPLSHSNRPEPTTR